MGVGYREQGSHRNRKTTKPQNSQHHKTSQRIPEHHQINLPTFFWGFKEVKYGT